LTSDRPLDRTGAGAALTGFRFEPHHCFACGELNEHGLHLVLHVTPEGCWTETTLAPRFQGWELVAHGGIVTTLLDEVMAWSVIGRGTWGVTARISVVFRKPVPVGKPIRAEGGVVEDRRRTFRTSGRVLDAATGDVLAQGEGTFVAAPPGELARLKARYRLRQVADEVADGAAPGTALGEPKADTTERVAPAVGPAGSGGRR
jgi:acyl-coenzyme A thioesterase PaaI-like protein